MSALHAAHMKAAAGITQRPACTSPAPRRITAATFGSPSPRCLRCRGLLDGFLGGGNCRTCNGKGAITCPECKGVGRNKKQGGGNIFERYKCYNCQGFGQVQCPKCGKAGLTPEQRGER